MDCNDRMESFKSIILIQTWTDWAIILSAILFDQTEGLFLFDINSFLHYQSQKDPHLFKKYKTNIKHTETHR